MYDKIKDFCKVKNKGGAHMNGQDMSNRVKWILETLNNMNIDYVVDEYTNEKFGDNKFHNIVMLGSSENMITAHHDIVNVNSDNANDNSASIINAIMVKKLRPDINVVLLDGEEPPMMGVGSTRCSHKINGGDYGNINSVLNLELTGKGGENFFIGNYDNELVDKIQSKFNCPIYNTPFNDADIFNRNGITSTVINPLPITDSKTIVENKNGYLDISMLYNCHSIMDSLETIDINDMKTFVEKVLLKIF
jgi:hypothetical protein